MAEVSNKKTTTKKTTTKKDDNNELIEMLMKQIAELQSKIDGATETEKVADKPVKAKRSKTVTFQDIKDKEVEVIRVVSGQGMVYWMDKKTGDEYVWNEYGESQYMTVEALKRMNTAPYFLKTPWLKVMDEEAVEVLKLKELYENIELLEDLDKLKSMSDFDILAMLDKMSKEYKQTLATNIASLISNNELTDVLLIRRFERLLDKQFLI